MEQRKYKNGFVVLELIIICVILALIAGVSLVGFSRMNLDGDQLEKDPVISELNELIKEHLDKGNLIETVTDAGNVVSKSGYEINKLTPYTDGYHYGYDLQLNKFTLLDDTFSFAKGYELADSKYKDVFAFVKSPFELNKANIKGLSIYLQSEFSSTDISGINNGLDVGDNSRVTKIEMVVAENAILYTNSYYQDVVISSNSTGTLNHYGKAGEVDVNGGTYKENGICSYMIANRGEVILGNNGEVTMCYEAGNDVKIDARINCVDDISNIDVEEVKTSNLKKEIALNNVGVAYNISKQRTFTDFVSFIKSVEKGDVAMLLSDVDCTSDLEIAESISLDLYGHDINLQSNSLIVSEKAEVNLTNSLEEAKVVGSISVIEKSKLTVKENVEVGMVFVKDTALFRLEGGKINSSDIAISMIGGNVKITSGVVEANSIVEIFENQGEIIITGGSFKVDPSQYLSAKYEAKLKDNYYIVEEK